MNRKDEPLHATCPNCLRQADAAPEALPRGYDPRLVLFVCPYCTTEFFTHIPHKEVKQHAKLLP